jgi:hypothetical protein
LSKDDCRPLKFNFHARLSEPYFLLGHGGSGHKRANRQLMLARRLASVSQMSVVTIDGPSMAIGWQSRLVAVAIRR